MCEEFRFRIFRENFAAFEIVKYLHILAPSPHTIQTLSCPQSTVFLNNLLFLQFFWKEGLLTFHRTFLEQAQNFTCSKNT